MRAMANSMPASLRCASISSSSASFTLRRKLQPARRRHLGRVGVDRLGFGKFATVENICVASKITKFSPAFCASIAAETPETPPPMIARSSTPFPDRLKVRLRQHLLAPPRAPVCARISAAECP